ncbi:MAG: hypothetical protein ABJN42_09830 [Roseibium sp.]|uniref:hypothetical protein n=1 Tax=Roseibium sp. TaxID=1936156 RepID=UPI003297DF1A
MTCIDDIQTEGDFRSGDPSRVIMILRTGMLVAAWLVLAAHYNAYHSPFTGIVELLRVLFIPALMVLGYSAFITWVIGAKRRVNGQRSWLQALVGLLTLSACLAVAA